MKKIIIIIIAVFLLFLIVLSSFGIQIGSFKIGAQPDEVGGFSTEIENSQFSKKYLKTDSLVVINLWATWCKPCIEEMPQFAKLAKTHSDVKFAFLSIDKDKEKLQKFLGQNSINDITLENADYRRAIQNFLEGRSLSSLVNTEIVPITYILKKGKIVHKETGGIDYEEFSKKLTAF